MNSDQGGATWSGAADDVQPALERRGRGFGAALRLLRDHGASWVAIASIAFCGIALRLYGIERLPGINGDEPQYAVHARSLLNGEPVEKLRTGSDLVMNPVFFVPVVVLQALLPSNLWTLRMGAVVQSLATIALSYALFRVRGRAFAALFAFWVAVLPVHLGYARFAWDPTAIPTAAVLALAAATRLRPLLTLLAFGLSLWVHPTSVFLLPVLVTPFLLGPWPRDDRGQPKLWNARSLGIAGLAAGTIAALITLPLYRSALPGAVQTALAGDRLDQIADRARHPLDVFEFIGFYLELLSGPTIYRYIVGAVPDGIARLHVGLAWLITLVVGGLGVRELCRERRRVDLGVAAGVVAALVFMYLVAGPVATAPKTERYAMCLTIPGCYVIAACIDALATSARRANLLRWSTAAVGAGLLISFTSNYLVALHRPVPERENTFRTGHVEPKRRALQIVRRMRDPSRTTLVYVEDWWIYWTVRYLAPPETGIRFTIRGQPKDFRFPSDYDLPEFEPGTMDVFGIVWADQPLDREYAARSIEHRNVRGYEPQPILRVYKLHAP